MKLFRLFIVLLLSLSVTSCSFLENLRGNKNSESNNTNEEKNESEGSSGENGTQDQEKNEGSEDQTAPDGSVKMKAKIIEIGERITVEVLESEYTSGIHWVITPDATEYYDENENKISRSDLKENDTVEIFYSGQVMMSYPPQIVAAKMQIVK